MTTITTGFDGTIDEVGFSSIMRSAGVDSSVSSTNAYRVTAAGDGTRRVKVGAGRAYAAGITEESDAIQYVTIPAPASAGWYLVALRRDWNTNKTSLIVLAGATQSSTTPTMYPSTYPAGFTQIIGNQWDQPLAWVFSTLGSTSFTIVDLRPLMLGNPRVGSSAERDQYWVIGQDTFAQRMRMVEAGAVWYNTDYNWLERYVCEYDATFNVRGAAGGGYWYPDVDLNYVDSWDPSSVAHNFLLSTITLPALPYPTEVFMDAQGQAGFRAVGDILYGIAVANTGNWTFTGSPLANVTPDTATWGTVTRQGWGRIPAGVAGTIQLRSISQLKAGGNTNGYTRGAVSVRRSPLVRKAY